MVDWLPVTVKRALAVIEVYEAIFVRFFHSSFFLFRATVVAVVFFCKPRPAKNLLETQTTK